MEKLILNHPRPLLVGSGLSLFCGKLCLQLRLMSRRFRIHISNGTPVTLLATVQHGQIESYTAYEVFPEDFWSLGGQMHKSSVWEALPMVRGLERVACVGRYPRGVLVELLLSLSFYPSDTLSLDAELWNVHLPAF